MENEVWIRSAKWRCGTENPTNSKGDMRREWPTNSKRECEIKPRAYACGRANDMSPAQIAQYLKGKSSHRLQREFRELQKRYWGQHLWARGYFCATVGAVNEEMIKKYIENQAEEEGNFKVWDIEPKAEEKPKNSLGGFIRKLVSGL